ncbi:hypothetical protein LCGC14_1434700 [marine sediment metagenome]|uniref:Uncharacterized protein n=1 Tax=marine sediment metagenome TaxID=412755 RepID=A0A0F9K8S3_9ZZZZ
MYDRKEAKSMVNNLETIVKRQESNRIAVELDETLTWDRVANHMRDHYGYDPDNCQLSEVILSVRKLMRQVVQVVEDDEDSVVDVRKRYCSVCGQLCEGHGEL